LAKMSGGLFSTYYLLLSGTTMAIDTVTPGEVLYHGLNWLKINASPSRSLKERLGDFSDHYCVDPASVSAAFSDLQTTTIDAARISNPNLRHLLMALYWMKTYDLEKRVASRFQNTPKTTRKWIKHYVCAIAALSAEKVRRMSDDVAAVGGKPAPNRSAN